MIAGVDQGGDGEAAASGLSREGDVRRGRAVVQEGLVGGQSVIDRRRVRVLGGEPVVDGDDRGAGPPADLRGQAGGWKASPSTYTPPWKYRTTWRGSTPSTVISAVGTPPSAAAVTVTPAGSGCADISSRSSRRCSLTSLPAGKADCRRIASRVSRCSVLTEDLPSVGGGPAAPPGGLAHVNPLLKFPAGRRATASLAARQVRRRHRIKVIRATGAPQNQSCTIVPEPCCCMCGGTAWLSNSMGAGRWPLNRSSIRARVRRVIRRS